MTVVINRPCHDCAHREMCRIRDGLESALAGEFVTERALDPALELQVTVDISCGHYLAHRRVSPPATAQVLAIGPPSTALDRPPTALDRPLAEAAPPAEPQGEPGADDAPVAPEPAPEKARPWELPPLVSNRAAAAPVAPLAVELFPRQAAIVAAVRAAKGDQITAAAALNRTVQTVYGTVSKLRQRGLLPTDVGRLIDDYKARGTEPRSTAITPGVAARLDRDDAIAKAVAVRSRELTAPDPKPVDAHDEFVATRVANARAKAETNRRRLRGEA